MTGCHEHPVKMNVIGYLVEEIGTMVAGRRENKVKLPRLYNFAYTRV